LAGLPESHFELSQRPPIWELRHFDLHGGVTHESARRLDLQGAGEVVGKKTKLWAESCEKTRSKNMIIRSGGAMNVPHTLTSDVRYGISLVQAGMDGVISARKATDIPPVLSSPVWALTAIGAVVGASTASLSRNRKSGYGVAVGGLVGSVLGLGCGLAWASRAFTGALARGATRKINTVRDARWLEMNPIDYA
jgi:hypothetical protein